MVDLSTTYTNYSIRQSNFLFTEKFHWANDENLEELSIVWLDANINRTDDSFETINTLSSIISNLKLLGNIDECIDYIDSTTIEEEIFFIASGQLGESIVSKMYQSSKIVSICIFCYDKLKHKIWSYQYEPKIRGIFVEKDSLYSKLIADVRFQIQNSLPMSILSEDAKQRCIRDLNKESVTFMWFQLLIKILINMKREENGKDEMINLCRKQYKTNQSVTKQIEEFHLKYYQNQAIEWYSKNIFLFRLLNRAFRKENIDAIYKFRFFIRDLHFQVDELHHQHTNQSFTNNEMIVYRGQQMSKNELKTLEENQNGLISVNTFFSTSKSYNIASGFTPSGSSDYPIVIFTIKINNQIHNDQPFAILEGLSSFHQEEEVLFTIGTVFRINFVEQITDTFWSVQLTLASKENSELSELINSLEEEIGEEPTLIQLGKMFFYMSDNDRVEKYNRILLEQLSLAHEDLSAVDNNIGDAYLNRGHYETASEYYYKALSIALDLEPKPHIYLAHSYDCIGLFNDRIGKYDDAIEYLKKARDIKLKYVLSNERVMESTYNNLAMVYRHKADNENSLENYKKVLEIELQSLHHLHPNLASVYNNIALLNSQIGNYNDAWTYYTKALEIELKSLPSNHYKIGTTYNNIALLHVSTNNQVEALEYYEKALNIFLVSLQPDHSNIGSIYYNMGDTSYKIGDSNRAMDYFKQALQIQIKSLLKDHIDLAKTWNGIAVIYCEKNNYIDALEHCQRALDIQLKSLPIDHPDLAGTYFNMGTINSKLDRHNEALNYYLSSLKIFKDDYPNLAVLYSHAGKTYLLLNNYQQTIQYYKKALETQLKMSSIINDELAIIYKGLGLIYNKQGQYVESIKNYKQALEIQFKLQNQLEISIIYSYIGENYHRQRQYQEALKNYRKTIEIQLNLSPIRYLDLAIIHSNMGFAYYAERDYQNALECFKQAFKIQIKCLEQNHPSIILPYNKIGAAYRELHNYNNALKIYTKILEIQANSSPDNDFDMAKTLNNIGFIFCQQGYLTKALENFNKALEIQCKCSCSNIQ
ncbi:unnamed protein product [Rotaria sp. Silwood2]|nr:unnamed protein product [Rotaria sp. Silwood2]